MPKASPNEKKPARRKQNEKVKPIENGELIQQIREDIGLTQSEMASLLEISVPLLAKYEKGIKKVPPYHFTMTGVLLDAFHMNPMICNMIQTFILRMPIDRTWFMIYSQAFGTPTVFPVMGNVRTQVLIPEEVTQISRMTRKTTPEKLKKAKGRGKKTPGRVDQSA